LAISASNFNEDVGRPRFAENIFLIVLTANGFAICLLSKILKNNFILTNYKIELSMLT